jgi:hypothetical protein
MPASGTEPEEIEAEEPGAFDDEEPDEEALEDDEEEDSAPAPADDEEGDGSTSLDQLLAQRASARRASADDDDDDEIMALASERHTPLRASISTRVIPIKDRQEFVCKRCHLVKKKSQLADPQRGLCRDCV